MQPPATGRSVRPGCFEVIMDIQWDWRIAGIHGFIEGRIVTEPQISAQPDYGDGH